MLIFCIAAPILRTLSAVDQVPTPTLWFRFEHAGDAIGWGCLYALAREHKTLPTLPRRVSSVIASITLIVLLLMTTGEAWPMLWSIIGTVCANLLIVFFLHNALHAEETLLYRFLNSSVLTWIGTLSYSLYLWQQVFLYGRFKLEAPYNLVAISLAALGSYYLIERPFLNLKNRISSTTKITDSA